MPNTIYAIESNMDRKRRSVRLPGYDYSSPGAYLVTVCTHGHEYLLGNVTDGHMLLNVAGRGVQTIWNGLPDHYPNVVTDAFVVMPDHIHGIIVLTDGIEHGDIIVGAGFKSAPTPETQYLYTKKHGLPEIVREFKTFSAKRINEIRRTSGISVWQRGYHEHVIRKNEDINRVREYILNNPLRWSLREKQ